MVDMMSSQPMVDMLPMMVQCLSMVVDSRLLLGVVLPRATTISTAPSTIILAFFIVVVLPLFRTIVVVLGYMSEVRI